MTRCDLVSEFSSRCIANTGCSDVICREDCNILVKLCTNNTDNTSYTVCAGLPSTQCLHLYNYLPPPFTLSNSAVYHVIVTNNLALDEDRMRGVHVQDIAVIVTFIVVFVIVMLGCVVHRVRMRVVKSNEVRQYSDLVDKLSSDPESD